MYEIMKKYFSVRHFPGQRRLMFEAKQKEPFFLGRDKGPGAGETAAGRRIASKQRLQKGKGMENLVKRAQKRDADAFTELMRMQMQNMYKAAKAILSNEEDVADAIQDTILTCWEKLGQLASPPYFRTWMTRILINKCNDILRKRERLNFTDEVPEIPVCDTGYGNMEWNEALNSLDEKYRLVILLYYVEGYKTSEISQILEIPESKVRTRLARGREKMAAEYRQTGNSAKPDISRMGSVAIQRRRLV